MEHAGKAGSPPYEDRALKAAMHLFCSDLLPYLGIEDSLEVIVPTESVVLEMKVTYGDFNFKSQRATIVHMEFQSSNQGAKGLRKYRLREAALGDQYEADVVTYVIYSGNVKNPMTELPGEENTYSIRTVMLKNENADEVFEELQQKLKEGGKVERGEVLRLLLTPLMDGEMEQYEHIKTGFYMVKQCEEFLGDPYETERFQGVLYALAVKFLDVIELEKLKEVIGVTELGRMLTQDAYEKGMEKGKEEGRNEMINEMVDLLKTGKSPLEIVHMIANPLMESEVLVDR